MRKITIFFPLLGYLHIAVGIYVDENLDSTSKMLQNGRVSVSAENRILTNIMMPGDRVSAMDKDGAICSADIDSDQNVEIERTEINYYYAIESTTKISTEEAAGRSMIRLLEDKLFRAIRPALLWFTSTNRHLSGATYKVITYLRCEAMAQRKEKLFED